MIIVFFVAGIFYPLGSGCHARFNGNKTMGKVGKSL